MVESRGKISKRCIYLFARVTQTFDKLCLVSYAKRNDGLLPLMKRLCIRNFQSNNDK